MMRLGLPLLPYLWLQVTTLGRAMAPQQQVLFQIIRDSGKIKKLVGHTTACLNKQENGNFAHSFSQHGALSCFYASSKRLRWNSFYLDQQNALT